MSQHDIDAAGIGVQLTGFADEAGSGITTQIRATKELGWDWLELRNVNGASVVDIDDAAFADVVAQLAAAGLRVSCIGSAIANWACDVRDPFEQTLDAVARAIERMRALQAQRIRIMSYKIIADRPATDQLAAERFRRLREIVARFEQADITVYHENCANYGGLGWTFSRELIDAVPGLRLLFDTANPATSADHTKPAPPAEQPHPRQSSWEFYERLRDRIEYVHIKDGEFVAADPAATFDKARYTWPGDGRGDVRRIVADLLARGYTGFFSIEPHLSVVFHETGPGDEAGVRYANYVEYGRRFEALLKAVHAA